MPIIGDFEHSRESQLVLVRAQGAEPVGKLLRKHRDSPVHEIDGSSALLGDLVQRRARLDIIGNIGDVHAHFEIAVVKFDE